VVRKRERPFTSTKHSFVKGQVLYSKLRPYLNKVLVASEDGYCTSEILPLPFNIEICSEYVRAFLMSDYFLSYANQCSYGVKMPRLGTNDGKKALFALPPLGEQERIADAVNNVNLQLDSIAATLA
jgi:type I restriction enzyme S subunit